MVHPQRTVKRSSAWPPTGEQQLLRTRFVSVNQFSKEDLSYIFDRRR
jgi:hypothetical protein